MSVKLLKQLLNADGDQILVGGSNVIDTTTGKTFADIAGECAAQLPSSTEKAYLTNAGAANGVALLDANGHLPTSAFDSTKIPVESTVADIDARDALTGMTDGAKVFVTDASDDETVASGWAIYRYGNESWTKVAEGESLDVVTAWSNITGKPSSTPTAIDGAVDDSHTHSNKTTLDGISANSDGDLSFNGKALDGATGVAFVADDGDTPAFDGKLVMVLESYTPAA